MLGKKDFLSGGYIFNNRMVHRLIDEGVQVDAIHFTTVPEDLPPRPVRGAAYVCRRILRFDPDVVVISKSYHYAWLFRMIEPLVGIPVVYLMHSLEWMEQQGRARAGMYSGYVRWLLGMADAIWVNSTSTMNGVLETGIPPDRVVRIPPGFEKTGEPLPDRSAGEAPVRLLCVGSIAPRKAHDVLIKACALLEEGSFSLELAGSRTDGASYPGDMARLVSDLGLDGSVTFLGNLSDDELMSAYDRADVLIQPSRWEAFGMAVVEGMWRGLPVVASGVAALPELVHHGVNGLLVPPDDPEALAFAIGTLVSDPDLRLRMGRESRSMASECNDWNDTERDFVRLVFDTAGSGTSL